MKSISFDCPKTFRNRKCFFGLSPGLFFSFIFIDFYLFFSFITFMKINKNIQFLYDAERSCLIVGDPQSTQAEKTPSITNFKTRFFKIKARDYRLEMAGGSELQSRYARYVPMLTLAGMREIAQYYNAKYFNSNDKADRKICVTQGLEEINTALEDFFNNPILRLIGLTCPRSLEEEESHPVTIIAEKQGEAAVNIYLADGMPSGFGFEKSFCGISSINQRLQDDKVIIYNIQHFRQASRGHCKSEALLFLKNALQLDTIASNVWGFDDKNFREFKSCHNSNSSLQSITWIPPIKLKDRSYNTVRKFFICQPPLLKTLQLRSYIDVCEERLSGEGIEARAIKLYNTKNNEHYNDFFIQNRKKSRYYWFNYSKLDRKHIFNIQPNNYLDIEENGYLARKSMEHYVFLSQKLEQEAAAACM